MLIAVAALVLQAVAATNGAGGGLLLQTDAATKSSGGEWLLNLAVAQPETPDVAQVVSAAARYVETDLSDKAIAIFLPAADGDQAAKEMTEDAGREIAAGLGVRYAPRSAVMKCESLGPPAGRCTLTGANAHIEVRIASLTDDRARVIVSVARADVFRSQELFLAREGGTWKVVATGLTGIS